MKVQVTPDIFFERLQARFRKYAQAIPVKGDSGMILHMLLTGNSLVGQVRNDHLQFNTLGSDSWGYGLNAICDGIEEYTNVDVLKIEKIDELNKHIKYNLFWLLIFRVDGELFRFHLYCIDTVTGKVNSNLNKSFSLKSLKSVSIRRRDISYFIDLSFEGVGKYFSFELDTLYNPAYIASIYKEFFEQIIEANLSVSKSLHLHRIDPSNFLNTINAGETKKIEFKESLRWDKRKKSVQSHVEHAVVKTIAAFLNSEGGTLFIGIDDAGKSVGIIDDFKSFQDDNKLDAFRRHFDNIIGKNFGNQMVRLISLDIFPIDGKEVAVINISSKASSPVYIDLNGKELFYVRRESSTIDLKTSEAVEYIKEHWK